MTADRPDSALRPYVTDDQRRAADPALSVWVAASAGAGKTKVLADRVLRLLLDGVAPERLLCLTFTRAAAAEMAIRINGELGEWTMLADDELHVRLEALTGAPPEADLRERARRQVATVLEGPGGLKIMTIHAFCQSLLGRFPLEAGVAPHSEVLDERSAAELLVAAQAAVLDRARGDAGTALAEALDVISAQAGEETFIDLMAKLRAARGRLRRLIRSHQTLDGLVTATERLLGVRPEETVEAVIGEACAEGAFNREALLAACRALEHGSGKDRERAACIGRWIDASPAERSAMFGAYASVFLTADDAPRKESQLMTKAVREGYPDAFEALLTEQEGVARVGERRKAVTVARATAALLRLGGAMLAAYDRAKAARARLDYDDLILGARDLLRAQGVAAWVLYKLDGGIDHILVDEAQDTSPEQWEVIAALADEFFAGEGARETPRTVFVVGDEKQSIFSFQGADLRTLEAMRAHFRDRVESAARKWREVGLGLSFRSTEAVLEAVDAVFARPAARDGVAFADHVIAHASHRKGHAGTVELWPLVTPRADEPAAPWTPPVTRTERDSPRTRLARHIAHTIDRWITSGEGLAARGRLIRPGDVMVLVRTRTGFVAELVRALKGLGVPVAGADRLVLTDHLAVMDLVALGEFLLLPADDLTLATVLKGPLIGFDEDDLFALAYDRGKSNLWRTLVRRRRERPAFARAHEALSGLLARADFTPPYELFAGVLGAGAGRRKLVARLGPDANDPLDEFLTLALAYERGEPPSLQGFLHWLRAGDVEVKRDLEHGRDEVRVLTVHGAKGLQAPVVFLPDTTSLPQARGPQLLWYGDDGDEALLWPGRGANDEARCRAAREAMRAREVQEYRRLLYVAMTRAEDRLYVCGWQGRNAIPEQCWYRLVESALAEGAEPFDFDGAEAAPRGWAAGQGWRIVGRQTRDAEADDARCAPEATPESLPRFARTPPEPEPAPPRPLAPSRPAEAEPAVSSPRLGHVDAARFRRGRVIHRLLQVLPELPPEDRAAACRRLLARPGHGLDAAAQAEVAAEVLAVLDDPRFAPLFGPGSRAEAPLIGVVGDRVVAGQMDRLVVADEAVMVVDYKTNRPPPASEAETPAAYLAQMAAYRAVLAQIYPDRSIRCALLWTDGPRLMHLSDAVLARHAP